VADKTIENIEAFAKSVNQESTIHYHEDNQYADSKKSEGCAKLFIDQNIFVTKE
jgi:hypothetical protein